MDYKKCYKCGEIKEISLFYKHPTSKDGYAGICKSCQKLVVKRSVERRKEEVKKYQKKYHKEHKLDRIVHDLQYKSKIEALKTPCIKCGDTRLYIIDFHHINPSEKSFNINRISAKSNFQIIETEVTKCVCLCRNCHAEFHQMYGQHPKNPEAALADYLGERYEL